jgi:photosystem II stability/assembly factor-like uncharacterized protein
MMRMTMTTKMHLKGGIFVKKIFNILISCSLYSVFLVAAFSQGATPQSSIAASSPASGWFWQNPLPQGNDLYGAFFITTSNIVAVGSGGTIIQSTDGGSHWSISSIVKTIHVTFRSVYFTSATNGWVVGDSGIVLKTTDGGQSWNQASIGGYTMGLNIIQFPSSTTGWIAGQGGAIFRTTNAGTSWSLQPYQTQSDLLGESFISPTIGWFCGFYGTVVRTINGGVTWDTLNANSASHLNGIHFLDQNTGWVVTSGGKIIGTTNGGTAWTASSTSSDTQLNAINFIGTNRGTVVGDQCVVLQTANGGSSWFSYSLFPFSPVTSLNAVATILPSSGMIVGSQGRMWNSTDFGVHWASIPNTPGDVDDLRSLFVLDSSRVWAVGKAGRIVTSYNGGAQWFDQTSGLTSNLNACQFIDALRGVAVGDTGTIIFTTDGGSTWTPSFSGVLTTLNAVSFSPDIYHGVVLGDDGTVLSTTNGGVTWQSTVVDTAINFKSLAHTPDGTLWAAGDSSIFGKIFSSSDQGTSWTIHDLSNPTKTLNSIYFMSQSFGCAVGNSGFSYVTSDGGATWIDRYTGYPSSIANYHSVFFVDKTGWAVGDKGIVVKSNDNGQTWSALSSGTGNNLYAVRFVDTSTGWIAGNGGTILRTNDGGGKTVVPPHPKPAVPLTIRLLQNYPNPSNPGTYITFELTVRSHVTIRISDILGKKVREFDMGVLSAGVYDNQLGDGAALYWDGKDAGGHLVPSGVYFSTLIVPDVRAYSKMVVIK